jgi:hypothetical protein
VNRSQDLRGRDLDSRYQHTSPGVITATSCAATVPVIVTSCGGTLREPSAGEFRCSLGQLCAVAATIRTYYAIRDETLIAQIRGGHPDSRPDWVQRSVTGTPLRRSLGQRTTQLSLDRGEGHGVDM